MTALERALADLVGGYDGGFTLWEVACGKLERVGRDARDEWHFRNHPAGALNRLLVDVQDALRVASLAVELQAKLDDEPDTKTGEQRSAEVAGLLLARARELVDRRLGLA